MANQNFILHGSALIERPRYSSVGEYFFNKMPENGARIAVINAETGEQLSYNQLLQKSLKLSLSLEKLGLTLNDKIGICSENNLNFTISVISNIFLGTTICLLNPTSSENELLHILTISKPKYIFVSQSALEKLQKMVANLTWSAKLILLDEHPNILNLPDLIARIPDDEVRNFRVKKINPKEHVLLIVCSSGTTGLPKGVMLTDNNLLSLFQGQIENLEPLVNRNTVVSGLLPMFHMYGQKMFLLTMAFSSRMVIFSKFDERGFLNAVEKYRIETLCLVPTIFVILLKSSILGDYDLSSVKYLLSAASVLPPKVAEGVKKLFNNPVIYNGYGMTETSSFVTYSADDGKNQSIGHLQPGCTAKIIPLDGDSKKTLGPNCEGELCFKGEVVMKGYCGDEEATKAAIDEDGFIHTGDVGYYNEEEYFFVIDRVKELIKYKGFQVPPAELEAILLAHPKIKDAAVVGMPDDLAGELPLAFVVRQPAINISAEEIISYVNERVSSHKRLRGGIRFIDAIPRNPTGKIQRRNLRELLKPEH